METWYKLNEYKFPDGKWIEPVQVEKHTASTVWINGSGNRIRSDYANYFPTFEEAQAFGINRIESEIEGLKNRLTREEFDLNEIKTEKP